MSNIEWSGEGLPPVGTVCEIAASTEYLKISHPEGTKVKVYANFTDDRGVELAAFVDAPGKVAGVAVARCFRPIRTPEQIAAEEREKAAKDMATLMTGHENHLGVWGCYVILGEILYDAGYRRLVAP